MALTIPTIKLEVNSVEVEPEEIIELTLHLGCTTEVSNFEVVIDNGNPDLNAGDYYVGGDKEFSNGQSVLIHLKRGSITGSTKSLFTGKVEDITIIDEAEDFNYRNVVIITGRCLGSQLFDKKFTGDLIAAAGSGKAETVVAYLIDNYTSLSHVRDSTDLIETSNTTFTELIFNHETIWDIIKYIADVTSTVAGIIGYDFRVEYDGKFAFLPRNTYTEPYSPLTGNCQLERYDRSIAQVKNKIWVYGKDDKPYPLDLDGQNYSDQWTEVHDSTVVQLALDAAADQKEVEIPEGAAALYGLDSGDHLWIIDSDDRGEECVIDTVTVEGGENDVLTMEDNLAHPYETAEFAIVFSLEDGKNWGYRPGTQWNELGVALNNSIVDTGSWAILITCLVPLSSISVRFVLREGEEVDLNEYVKMLFKFYFDTTAPDGVRIYLYSGDCQGNSFAYSNLLSSLEADKWSVQTLECGKTAVSNWTIFSSFDWTDVKMIEFVFTYAAPGDYNIRLDRFHFSGKRWGGGSSNLAIDGFAEDVGVGSSQAKYGIKEYVLINDMLLSETECEAKAQSLLAFYKDERKTIELSTETLDWGDDAFTAGNKIAINFGKLGVNSTFRTDSIDINVSGKENRPFISFLINQAPPRIADYLYRLSKRIRQMNRGYARIR